MLNVGTPELLVILLVGLLVLGPNKLPEAARQVGRAVAELRRISSGFQNELRNAMEEPTIQRSPTPLATPPPDLDPSDHEAMNAQLAAARDQAIATSRSRREPLKAVKKAPATAKKRAPAKKAAAAKKAPAAKKKTS